MRKFRKLPHPAAMWCGVCAGFAYFIGVPTWIVRIALVFITIAAGMVPVMIYLGVAFLAPDAKKVPGDYSEICDRISAHIILGFS